MSPIVIACDNCPDMIEDIVNMFGSSVLKCVVPFQGFTKLAAEGILNYQSDQILLPSMQ